MDLYFLKVLFLTLPNTDLYFLKVPSGEATWPSKYWEIGTAILKETGSHLLFVQDNTRNKVRLRDRLVLSQNGPLSKGCLQ